MKRVYKFKDIRLIYHSKVLLIYSFFSLFDDTSKKFESTEKTFEDDLTTNDYSKIRCPKCCWQPKSSSLWYCCDCDFPEYFYNGCDTAWNTFDTFGKCPTCQHQWKWTTCLFCGEWSLHEDWYVID